MNVSDLLPDSLVDFLMPEQSAAARLDAEAGEARIRALKEEYNALEEELRNLSSLTWFLDRQEEKLDRLKAEILHSNDMTEIMRLQGQGRALWELVNAPEWTRQRMVEIQKEIAVADAG